jgi:hypothetical protein
MDYKVINSLAIEYKTNKKVIVDLLEIYEPIYKKYIRNIPRSEHDEVRSIFNLQLIQALESFDNNKSTFNTYCFYYLAAVPRLYHSQNTYFNNKLHKSHLQEYDRDEDDLDLLNLNLDIPNIFSSEERLLYRAYVNGQIQRWSERLEPILSKLKKYIRNN